MKDIASDDLVQRINSGKLDGIVIDIRNENETKNGYFSEAILLPMSKIRTHALKILKPE
jgi:predicted sulfurtransferase